MPVVGQVAGLIRSVLQEFVVQTLSLMTQLPLYGTVFGTSSIVPWILTAFWAKAEVGGTVRRASAVSPIKSFAVIRIVPLSWLVSISILIMVGGDDSKNTKGRGGWLRGPWRRKIALQISLQQKLPYLFPPPCGRFATTGPATVGVVPSLLAACSS